MPESFGGIEPLVQPGSVCGAIREEDSKELLQTSSPSEIEVLKVPRVGNASVNGDADANFNALLNINAGTCGVSASLVGPNATAESDPNEGACGLGRLGRFDGSQVDAWPPDAGETKGSELDASLLDPEEKKEFLEYFDFEELKELELLFKEADIGNTGFLQAAGLLSVLQQIQMEGIESNPSIELCRQLVDRSRGKKEDMGEGRLPASLTSTAAAFI